MSVNLEKYFAFNFALEIKDFPVSFGLFAFNKIGETFNIGANNELTNNEITDFLISKVDKKLNRPDGKSKSLITYIKDRLGHDKRYAIDNSKICKELGWKPKHSFIYGIEKTIDWYLDNLN